MAGESITLHVHGSGVRLERFRENNTHGYFKPLTIIDVELRPLLMKEGLLYKNLQRIRNASMFGVDVGGTMLRF